MRLRVIGVLTAAFVLSSMAMAQQEIELTWWINPWRIVTPDMTDGESPTGEEYARYMSEQFMELHPNVTVHYELVPNAGFGEKVTTAIFAGNPPDVLKDLNWNPDWAREGLLEPIDDYLTEADRADFLGYALEKGNVDGQHYIWPWNNSNNGMGSTMILNTALFEEAGVELPALPERSWTIEEFMDAAEQLTMDRDGDGTTDVYAITFAARDTENMLSWLFRFGAQLINDEGTEFVLNSEEGVRALQFVVDLIYEHGYAPTGGEALDVYGTIDNLHQQRAAIGYGGIYEIGRIDRYLNEGRMAEPINVVLAPFPHDPEVGQVAYETSGGFLVFKQDDEYRREMAMELARFLTNKENIKMLESLLYITARRSANAELTFANVSDYTDDVPTEVAVYQAAIDHGVPFFGPSDLDISPAMEHFTAAMEAALNRNKTPQEALDDFVEAANAAVFGR
ncbi:MAG TPA: extracellular solute-binding protein [Trueperaceae bacterium]|nr:extracellular solute-binding protein [Trueperaceae bacterium]